MPRISNSEVSPVAVWLVFLGTGFLLFALSILYELIPDLSQKTGIYFPRISDLVTVPTSREEVLLASLPEQDSLTQAQLAQIQDSIRRRQILDSLLTLYSRIQFPPGGKQRLFQFFQQAEQARQTGRRIRILHYGDSQIEGERITAQIRNQLQKLFGGRGVGLVPIVPLAPLLSVHIRHSHNWQRIPGYGPQAQTHQDKRFGPLFTAFVYEGDSAWLQIYPARRGYWRARTYTSATLYYSLDHDSTTLTIQTPTNQQDTTLHQARLGQLTITLSPGDTLTLHFQGPSPRVYALSLEHHQGGILMDNIPLRGSSGLEWTKQDPSFLRIVYQELNPTMFILQFGGNIIPYIKDERQCKNYARWFSAQLKLIQRLVPNALILVIGPADMATRIQGKLQTYPYLECVRDALRTTALQHNALFWDMYINMGGRNTIIHWVERDTPLAAKDYVHFTIHGVRKIANLLWEDLYYEYQQYRQWRQQQQQHQKASTKTQQVDTLIRQYAQKTQGKG